MDHKRNINSVKISAAEKFALSAHIFDLTLLYKVISVFDLKQLLCGNGAKTDLSAELFKHLRACQGSGNAEKCGALRVVPAGVNGTRYGVAFGMSGADDGIQLAQDQHLGAGTARVQYGVEAGDVLGLHQRVAQSLEGICHIF